MVVHTLLHMETVKSEWLGINQLQSYLLIGFYFYFFHYEDAGLFCSYNSV